VAFVSATPSQGTYDSTTGVWFVGTLDPGPLATLTCSFTLVSPSTQVFTMSVAHEDQFDPNPVNNTASAVLGALQADLALGVSIPSSQPNVGDTIVTIFTLSDLGPSSATNVIVAAPLPAGVQFVAATPSQGTFNSTSGIWTVGTVTTVPPSPTLAITSTLASPSSQSFTATVSHSDEFDPSIANNSATGTVTPQVADVAVQASAPATVASGSMFTVTYALTNAGPQDATNVQLMVQSPATATFVSATPSQGTFDSTSGIWTVGTVVAGAAAPTLAIQYTEAASSGTGQSFTVTVSHADQFDPSTVNNASTATISVN
jgi:uncharacterized repeat protein (TIGR01451 family)